MKIKEVRCDQFAGLRDREIDLKSGLNLIIGENESGKSTLVELIYRMFFQSSPLDARRDKDFKENYFPKSIGKYQGDTIDGVIKFETEEGVYKLSKEWSKRDGTCKLTLPDGGTVRDPDTISEILAGILQYGKAVYDELVFASQRREQTVLNGLLGGKASDNVEELAGTITKAVMETGGIDIDKMENRLDEIVTSYEGHWDFDSDMPERGRARGIGNKWQKGVGRVLSAYYEKEEAAAAFSEAEDAERNVERINADIAETKGLRDRCREKKDCFDTVRSRLAERHSNKRLLEKTEAEYADMQKALSDWPRYTEQLAAAESLQKELVLSKTKAKYDKVKETVEQRNAAENKLTAIGEVDAEDVRKAIGLESEIVKCEGKLHGMDISTRVKKLGAGDVLIRSCVTGELLNTDGGSLDITEAVEISVPGVVTIELSPKDTDVGAIGAMLEKPRGELSAIFDKHSVSSVKELKEKQESAARLASELAMIKSRIEALLDGASWEELESEAASVSGSVRAANIIDADIKALCNMPIDRFIGSASSSISRCAEKYGSPEKLSADMRSSEETLRKLRISIASSESIPPEFQNINDPDEYSETLRNQIEGYEKTVERLTASLSEAERGLRERSAEEYAEDCQRANAVFEGLKAEHARWAHIRSVFLKVKNANRGDPLEDIEREFGNYLSVMSEGNIKLESIGEELNTSITSGNSQLTAAILSEGTKDTVSLAFRLAVLRHLYPDGGCVAVFDDPFTDMDPKRTKQACRLIEEFAKDNQVIFISCDEKYSELMPGNIIRV